MVFLKKCRFWDRMKKMTPALSQDLFLVKIPKISRGRRFAVKETWFLYPVQLVMNFLPIFPDKQYDQLSIRVGPFFEANFLEKWKGDFFRTFRAKCKEKRRQFSCGDPEIIPELFEPGDISIFSPENPQHVSQEIISFILLSNSKVYLRPVEEYLYWNVFVRLTFFGCEDSFLESEDSFGPFMDENELSSWWSKFMRGVRQSASEIGGIKFKIFNGEIVREKAQRLQVVSDLESNYVAIKFLNPRVEGKYYLSEAVGQWYEMTNK
jgi:hypothetical protein